MILQKRGLIRWLIAFTVLTVGLLVITTFLYFRMVKYIEEQENRYAYFWSLALAGLEDPAYLTDLQFSVIRANHQIPVVALDEEGNMISVRNLDSMYLQDDARMTEWLGAQSREGRVIPLRIVSENSSEGEVQQMRVVYGHSRILQSLRWYPWLQLGLVVVVGILLVLVIRESRKLQEREILFTLVRELHHQLRLPLATMQAWSEVLRESGVVPPDVVDELNRDIWRAREVVRRFSHLQEHGQIQSVPLLRIVKEVVRYLQKRWGPSLKIQVESPASPHSPRIVGDPVLLRWAIENAIVQSADRLQYGGGEIRVRIQPNGKWAVLEVQDNGPSYDQVQRCRATRSSLQFLQHLLSLHQTGKVRVVRRKNAMVVQLMFPVDESGE